jgi:SAM-dependent methyltransferase
MDHLQLVTAYLREPGVEIGAYKTPIPGIRPTYVDRFAEYAGEATRAEFYGDACDLPFEDASLGYVASSHVLEHVANPVAALREWCRVLRHNGIIYLVVPDRAYTFDRGRPVTDPGHMASDFERGVTQSDGTHIDDFVYGVDWRLYSPGTDPSAERAARDELAGVYRRSVAAGLEINIHFHVFDRENIAALFRLGNGRGWWDGAVEILVTAERFPDSNPNGILVLARVRKPWRARLRALGARKGLRPGARRF